MMRSGSRIAQRLGVVFGALALAGAGMLAVPASAQAASYNGVCGAGYSVVESAAIGNSGTLFLTWNGSVGKNCAVTVRNAPGQALWMEAWITRTATGGGDVDNGYYTTYAGPVYVDGRNTCIAFGGTIAGESVTRGPGHCG
ncbi:spore-associated protein A [Streptomyces sp. TRM S81-3]|uniref:Spore-associated protein A n=1 Tax=Streptomyces griseicoloratus TaxID=2752516 RepID=A0A926L8R7_9ACTN|nr:spore-associated protein A [Streptomyces griseicoloratus]MBD0424678.1 spore-associated protein A [Streptomyces griseicoloratus]